MYKFAWNITVKWNPKVELDLDFVESLWKSWNKNIFVFGETEFPTSKEILENFSEKFEILNSDLTVEMEWKLEIIGESYDERLLSEKKWILMRFLKDFQSLKKLFVLGKDEFQKSFETKK